MECPCHSPHFENEGKLMLQNQAIAAHLHKTSFCLIYFSYKDVYEVRYMKDYISERAVTIGKYMIEHRSTVRSAAKKFGISKSTVHTDRI